MIKETKEGIIVPIKVIPKAHRNEIIGWENDELKIKIRAVPDKGEANDALLHFLAKYFKISLASIILVSGATSRHKRVCISGLTKEIIQKALWSYSSMP